MNPSTPSPDSVVPDGAITNADNQPIEAEIIDFQPKPPSPTTGELEVVDLWFEEPSANPEGGDDAIPPTVNLGLETWLTPWGISGLALLLLANILLTWSQFTTSEALPEKSSPEPSLSALEPSPSTDSLSLSELSPVAEVPPPPTVPTAPKSVPVPVPPQPPTVSAPSLRDVLFPPSLRPQAPPPTVSSPPAPASVVPVSLPSVARPLPPAAEPTAIAPPPPPSEPELSPEDKLRAILREQVRREEASIKPVESFNHKTRQRMIELKYPQGQESAQSPPPPPSPAVSSPIPPAPSTSPPRATSNPPAQNVNQLVNQLEQLNRTPSQP